MGGFGYRVLGFGANALGLGRTRAALVKGADTAGVPQSTCYLYDRVGNSWTTKTGAPTALRQTGGCTAGGDLLSVPGGMAAAKSSNHEAYSFAGDAWLAKTAATAGRMFGISLSGTDTYNYINTNNAARNDEYTFTGDSFSSKNTASYGDWQLNQSTGNGISGIVISKGSPNRNDCEQFFIAGNSWAVRTVAPTSNREGAGATADPYGDFHHACCGAFTSPYNENERFSISGNSWSVKTTVPTAQNKPAATFLGVDEFYIAGGANSAQNEAYSQTGDSWVVKTAPPAPREFAGWDGN